MIRRSVGFMAVALRPGDNNDLVRLLQARLNRDYPLYSSLVVDGIYRPRTTAVVSEFQRRAGLQVDGIAGPQTLGRLGLNFDQPAPLPTDRPFLYCASGTWATAACSVRPALPAGHTGAGGRSNGCGV
jgi:peptidoglycan hydrolase-like protein with peptidoglycan-binding domain